jgi:predicted small secreted protein
MKKIIFAALIGAAALTGCQTVATGSSDIGSDAQSSVTSNCHDAIRDELKAPATAHFHGESMDHTTDGSGYSLVGSVDSENGFGALLTSTFICITDSSGSVTDSPSLIPS